MFFLAAIGMMALASLLNGWVLSVLWGWFFVPTFGMPELSLAQVDERRLAERPAYAVARAATNPRQPRRATVVAFWCHSGNASHRPGE